MNQFHWWSNLHKVISHSSQISGPRKQTKKSFIKIWNKTKCLHLPSFSRQSGFVWSCWSTVLCSAELFQCVTSPARWSTLLLALFGWICGEKVGGSEEAAQQMLKGCTTFTKTVRGRTLVWKLVVSVARCYGKAAQTGSLSFTDVSVSVRHQFIHAHCSFCSVLAGIRSWDIDLKICDLDQQLQLFITRHSAHFSTEVRGQFDVTPALLTHVCARTRTIFKEITNVQ